MRDFAAADSLRFCPPILRVHCTTADCNSNRDISLSALDDNAGALLFIDFAFRMLLPTTVIMEKLFKDWPDRRKKQWLSRNILDVYPLVITMLKALARMHTNKDKVFDTLTKPECKGLGSMHAVKRRLLGTYRRFRPYLVAIQGDSFVTETKTSKAFYYPKLIETKCFILGLYDADYLCRLRVKHAV